LLLLQIGLIYGIVFALHNSKPFTIVHNRQTKNRSNDFISWFIEQIQVGFPDKNK